MTEQVTIENNLNLIRIVQFTPELKAALKHFAHFIYDEIYFDFYVAEFPSGQLAAKASDSGPTFERRWRSKVSEPQLVGYALARPHDILDDLRAARRGQCTASATKASLISFWTE